MSKKKYKNAAEKQKAWRIRHGQRPKVPLELRRGEELGASETTFRERKEGETWEEYHEYVLASVKAARKRQASAKGAGGKEKIEKPGGDVKGVGVYSVDYYELQRQREIDLEKATTPVRRRIKEKKRT